MRVAWYLARASVRHRAPSAVAFAVVIGIVAAVVLSGIAGARRTETVYDRMVEDYRQPTATVFGNPENPDNEAVLQEATARVAELPQVLAYGSIATALVAQEDPPGSDAWIGELAFATMDPRSLDSIQRPLVVAGRRMDPASPTDVEVNEAWADLHGADVGTTFELGVVPRDQLDAAGNGFPVELAQEPITARVAAIVRRPGDLAPPRQGTEGTIDEVGQAVLYLSPAFWDEHGAQVASYGGGILLQLRSEADVEALGEALSDLEVQVALDSGENGADLSAIRAAVRVESRALLGASVLLGAVGVLLLGQGARRRGIVGSGAVDTVGLDRRTLAAAGAAEWGAIGAMAAVVGVAGAVALSPLTPIGIARRATTDHGVHVDWAVLAPGVAGLLLLLTAGGAVLGWVSGTRLADRQAPHRPSRLGSLLGTAGGPAGALGVRLALEPGAEAQRVPVRSTVLSGVLGIAALVGAVTFTASLDRLVEQPELRGWTWDHDVGNFSDAVTAAEAEQQLLDNPGVVEMSAWQTDFLLLDGHEASLLMLDHRHGVVAPPILEGRAPTGTGEVALGGGTLEQLGASVGDEVEGVGPSGEPVRLEIVGESVGISVLDDTAQLDEGAVMSFETALLMVPPEMELYPTGFLVRLADGDARREGLSELRKDFPGTVFGARSTSEIENVRRVQWLPRLVVVGVGVLALGSIAHALLSAVRHRRRELAVLKCLGMRRRQLVGLTMAQSLTVVVAAIALGMPLGIALGRQLWRLAAEQIGTSASPVVPAVVLLAGVAGVVALAVLIALPPGRAAARTPTALVLRTE